MRLSESLYKYLLFLYFAKNMQKPVFYLATHLLSHKFYPMLFRKSFLTFQSSETKGKDPLRQRGIFLD